MGRKVDARQEEFVELYWLNGGSTKKTAEKLGVALDTAYGWFKKPAFRKRIKDKRVVWLENLRETAYDRAISESDRLLEFLLISLDPDTYDKEYRRAKKLAKKGLNPDGSQPQQVVVVMERDTPPPTEEQQ